MALDQYWDDDEAASSDGSEMSFLEHLEALRWHLIRAVGSIMIFAIIALVFHKEIFRHVILAPLHTDFFTYRMFCKLGVKYDLPSLCIDKIDITLINREMTGQFSMAITYSIIIGLIFAFPYAFWEIWRFVKPGLRITEVKASRGAVFWVTLLFLMGMAFGYYVVSPMAINFLASFKLDETLNNQIDITSYIGFLSVMTLACGLTFQLPVVTYVLSKVGIVTPKLMQNYRRHAFVVILILSAIITPSPDILTQMLVAVPLYVLYEVSIRVSARVERLRKAQESI